MLQELCNEANIREMKFAFLLNTKRRRKKYLFGIITGEPEKLTGSKAAPFRQTKPEETEDGGSETAGARPLQRVNPLKACSARNESPPWRGFGVGASGTGLFLGLS